MWKKVEKGMQHFFSGSVSTKLDDKNRFVLPQAMRYGLVENGQLECTVALGMGGSLAIYKRSDIEAIVAQFRKKQHVAKFRTFFTLFFSTLHHTTCDKLGRIVVPPILKKAAGIDGEIVVAGVLNKIEIWPRAKYEADLELFTEGTESTLGQLADEAFALLADQQPSEGGSALLSEAEKAAYEQL